MTRRATIAFAIIAWGLACSVVGLWLVWAARVVTDAGQAVQP